MKGYLDRDETPVVDGWLDTGDVGLVHEGELYITGRAKDLVILHGRNHAPAWFRSAIRAATSSAPETCVVLHDVAAHLEKGILSENGGSLSLPQN